DRHRIRPVAHEGRIAVLKRESRLLFVPGEDLRWSRTAREQPTHEGEGANRLRRIDDDTTILGHDAAAECAKVLEEARDQPLEACALPHDAVGNAAGARALDVRICPLEALDLASQHLPFRAKRAARKGDD